jgi:hypothetical protein
MIFCNIHSLPKKCGFGYTPKIHTQKNWAILKTQTHIFLGVNACSVNKKKSNVIT